MKLEYTRAAIVWFLMMVCPAITGLANRPALGDGKAANGVQVVQTASPVTLGVVLGVPAQVAPGAEWDVSCVVTNQGAESLANVGVQIRRIPGLEVLSAQPGTLDTNCCANIVINGVASELASGTNVIVTVRMRAARPGVWPVSVQAFHDGNDPSPTDDERFVYAAPPGGRALAPDFSLPFVSAQWSSFTFQWVAWTGRTAVILSPFTLEPKSSVRFPGVVNGFHVNENGQYAWAILEGGDVARLNLNTGVVDLQFPVSLSLTADQGTIVSSPATPDVLVAFGPDAEGQPRLIAYDKGVPRDNQYTNDLATVPGAYRLAVSADQRVYAALGTQLRELQLDNSGLTLLRNIDSVGRSGGPLAIFSGILYNGAGETVELATLEVRTVGTLSPGLPNGISYNLELQEGGRLRVRAYSVVIKGAYWRQDIDLAQIPASASGGLFGAILLGAQGGLVAPFQTGVDLALSASLTNSVAALDEVVTVAVSVSKSGAWNGVNTLLIAELSDGVAAVNPASTSNKWVLPLGVLEESITTNISFQIKQAGTQTVTLRVQSDYTDPDGGNNSATLVWNRPVNQLVLEDMSVADDGQPLTLRLAAPAAEDIDVSFRLELLSASEADVIKTNVTARFLKGESTTTLSVVAEDTLLEAAETFRLVLDTSPVLATQPSALITITNDDRVTLEARSVAILEGDSGVTTHPVTLILSEAAEIPVTLGYKLKGGTATTGVDFEDATGEVTFLPGQRTNVIDVHIIGEAVLESDETFSVVLTAPDTVILPAQDVKVTILNDDKVRVLLADARLVEGNQGTNVYLMPVVLGAAAALPVEVGYTLRAGTATVGTDFLGAAGVLRYRAGQLTNYISISVIGDVESETNETVFVDLSAGVNVLLPAISARLTIEDDDTSKTGGALHLRVGVGGGLQLSFDTIAGSRYQVQSRASLSEGDWADNGAVWTGTGSPLEFEIDSRGRESYFRVLLR